MKYSARQYSIALREALETTGPGDQDKVLDNFVQLLAENGDLKLFEEISEEYRKLDLKAKGITEAEVTTAVPIDKATEKAVIETLNHYVKGDVELKRKIDEGLIGGCVIKIDDQVIDASIKHSLEQLKSKLTE
jgi:F-type H+-transporting ATPase subunit delta